jgi:Family of unknown function (DUF6088)
LNFFPSETLREKSSDLSHPVARKKGGVPMAMAMIGRFVQFLDDGQIFTTRDCLVFGMRSAVDNALSRLVKMERIRRLARGVFAKDSTFRRVYSDLEIATAKAESFGRRIVEAPLNIENTRSGDFGKPVEARTFYIDGHSSQFKIGENIISFKQTTKRKMQLALTIAGEAARAVWNLGQTNGGDGQALMRAITWFHRNDRIDLRKNIRWMPAWLSNQIKHRPWDFEYEKKLKSLTPELRLRI